MMLLINAIGPGGIAIFALFSLALWRAPLLILAFNARPPVQTAVAQVSTEKNQ
ncbi:MAG: hypothetical protein R3E44_08825 [Paracoccaceae bacterium]